MVGFFSLPGLATDDPWNATHFYIPAPFFLWDDSWYHGLEALIQVVQGLSPELCREVSCQACQADPDRVLQDHQRLSTDVDAVESSDMDLHTQTWKNVQMAG